MPAATPKQQKILDFIAQWQQARGGAPSYGEIAAHFGFRSLNAVTEHLRLLRQKGLLAHEPRRARAVRVLSPLARLRRPVADIPLFGSIPAGLAQSREQDAAGCISVDVATVGFKPTRNTFALRVTGDSMIGRHICDGDIAIFEHGPEPRPNQVVAALIDRKSTLKTFVVQEGRAYLKAENPKYPDLLPSEELLIQGVFRALIRKE